MGQGQQWCLCLEVTLAGLRPLQAKCIEQQCPLYVAFTDLTKAFNLVSRYGLFAILRRFGCPGTLLNMILKLHDDMHPNVQVNGSRSHHFLIKHGVTQECVLAPTLFAIFFTALLIIGGGTEDAWAWVPPLLLFWGSWPGPSTLNVEFCLNEFKLTQLGRLLKQIVQWKTCCRILAVFCQYYLQYIICNLAVNSAGIFICWAKGTMYSLSACNGLLTALVLFNSVSTNQVQYSFLSSTAVHLQTEKIK